MRAPRASVKGDAAGPAVGAPVVQPYLLHRNEPTRLDAELSAMSLRWIFTLVTTTIVTLALGTAAALVLLTTLLHRSATDLSAAVESVRLAEEMEIELLSYARTRDVGVRAMTGAEIEGLLQEFDRHVTTESEAELLRRARRDVRSYLTQVPGQQAEAALEPAIAALESLVLVNTEQARAVMRRAARWNRAANAIAAIVGVVLVVGTAGFLFWLSTTGLRPIFRLAEAMERFARGDRAARVVETGPTELRAMAVRFNAMATELARQQREQLEFIAGVVHDLRTPLSALRVSLALVPAYEDRAGQGRMHQVLPVIRRQVDRLERMLGDLLDASRIEAGHLELRIEQRDARDMARQVVALFEGASTAVEIALSLPQVPTPLRCDPDRIEEVLSNLLSNAIKYSPGGGKIEIRVAATDGEVSFTVSDRGMGIAPSELPHVFEPFRRAPSRYGISGTGLGLSVAKRIVEAHGGRIEAKSEQGVGSVFSVHLPVTGPGLTPGAPG